MKRKEVTITGEEKDQWENRKSQIRQARRRNS